MSVLKYRDPETGEIVKVGAPALDGYTKEEVDQLIAGIPVPDVSRQIEAHNTDTAAHSDIRAALGNIARNAAFIDSPNYCQGIDFIYQDHQSTNTTSISPGGIQLRGSGNNTGVGMYGHYEKEFEPVLEILGTDNDELVHITGVASPTTKFSAANKQYVDETIASAVNDANAQVGDILTTIRTDLGDKWMLCNGGTISQNDYPAAASLLPHGVGKVQTTYPTNSSVVRYVNGYWFVVRNARLLYAQKASGPWKDVNIDPSASGVNVYDINYANGYWVICGQRLATSQGFYYAGLWYATSITGSWTFTQLSTTSNTYATQIAYDAASGRCVICGRDNAPSTTFIWYTSNVSGAWTTYTNTLKIYTPVIYIESASSTKDVFLIGGANTSGNNMLYRVTISGTSTSASNILSHSTTNGVLNAIYIVGNNIFAMTDGYGYYSLLIGGASYSNYTCSALRPIASAYDNGVFYVMSPNGSIASTTNPRDAATWAIVDGLSNGSANTSSFAIKDGVVVTNNNNSNYYSVWVSGMLKLPSISVDGAYVYIKVEE